MATEAIDCTEARKQAINELWQAIVALECGEVESARNHANCALGWTREIQ